jgi:hypothetical protein
MVRTQRASCSGGFNAKSIVLFLLQSKGTALNRRFSRLLLTILGLTFAVTAPVAVAGPTNPMSDAEISRRIAAAGDASDYEGADSVTIVEESDVYVQPTGLANTESCKVIKLLRDAAVKRWSVLHEQYDPDTNLIRLNRVVVHHPDGTRDDVSLAHMVTQPTPQSLIFWGGEQQLLEMPRLAVGDVIEIRQTQVGFNIAYLDGNAAGMDASHLQPPMPGHWFEVTEFQRSTPILYKRYSVHAPIDMPIQYEVYNGPLRTSMWLEDDTRSYTFIAEEMPALTREPHMPATSDVCPKVVMATVKDWETKSRWFYEVNEGQFDADAAIIAKVQEITAPYEQMDDKMRACLHWVADNIRYYGTSRGPCEGFTLHRSVETFRDRGGVCKDKAGMLVTMLRVLGMEAYPALTMAGSRVEAVPADQFNHTVTVVRHADGSFQILDPTWSPHSRELWSTREATQGLVFGTPEGQPLSHSPHFTPEDNALHVRASSQINTSGKLTTSIAMEELTGYPCTYLRRNSERNPRPFQRARFEEMLNLAPGATIGSLAHIDAADYAQNGWLNMTVSAPGYAAGSDTMMIFKLPLLQHPLRDIVAPELGYDVSPDERTFDYKLRATRLVQYEESVFLPDGWVVRSMPDSLQIDAQTASLSFDISHDNNTIRYRLVLRLNDHEVAAAEYSAFRAAMQTLAELADQRIVVEMPRQQTVNDALELPQSPYSPQFETATADADDRAADP